MQVHIRETATKGDLKRFVKFPDTLYRGCPQWVPAMRADEYLTLSKKINPAFKHCEAKYFLAYAGNKVVGRVAAIINHNANHDWGHRTVRFGWFDFIDDYEVSGALLDAVANWGLEKGMDKISGPLGFSDMDKEGLLVDGFENLPSITTLYNFPYYPVHYEKYGLLKDIDWLQKRFNVPPAVPDKLKQYSSIVAERSKIHYYIPRNKRELKTRGLGIFEAMNESFLPLYEYTPLNRAQMDAYIKQYLMIVNTDLCCFVVDENEKMVAFAVTIPSLSKAVQRTKGRLFPFGFIHLLRGLKKYDDIEMSFIGVIPEYQNKGLNAMIFSKLHQTFIDYGAKRVYTNPQLETNKAVLALFDYYESEPYMRRRCYSKKLESNVVLQ